MKDEGRGDGETRGHGDTVILRASAPGPRVPPSPRLRDCLPSSFILRIPRSQYTENSYDDQTNLNDVAASITNRRPGNAGYQRQ